MKTFNDLYEFAQNHKESRIPLRSKGHVLEDYSMYVYGDGETILIEGQNPYSDKRDPLPIFRINYNPQEEKVYFNDLNDDGCDVIRNQHCLPMKAKISKMEEFGLIRSIVINLLNGFRKQE